MDMQEHLLALLAIAVAAGQIGAGMLHSANAPSAQTIAYQSAHITLPDAGAVREWVAFGLQEQANAIVVAEKAGGSTAVDGW